MEAEIKLKYRTAKYAEAVAKAVSPDNFKVPPGLSIETVSEENKVVTHIKCKKEIPTLTATVDDLLACITTAEKILRTTDRFA